MPVAPGCSASVRAPMCWLTPVCLTAAGPRPTGATPTISGNGSQQCNWTQTSLRGRRPGHDLCRQRGRHRPVASLAAKGPGPRLTRWPGGWSAAPHRSGGQQQFIERPVLTGPKPAARTAHGAPSKRHWIACGRTADMAWHVMPAPQPQRHFEQSLGMSPSRWVIRLRIRQASHLLESTQLGIDQVAQACGLRTRNPLRRHFQGRRAA